MKRIFRFCANVFYGVIGFGAMAGLLWIAYLIADIQPREKEYEVRTVEVEKPRPTVEQLLTDTPSKYGLDHLLAIAVAVQESGKIPRMDASRFESSQWEISKAVLRTNNEDQIRQGATSHCAMQVMGYNAYKFNLTWADLYDPVNCVEVSMAIMADCYRQESKYSQDESQRVIGTLRCYNAGPNYRKNKNPNAGLNYALEVRDRYFGLILRDRKRKGE